MTSVLDSITEPLSVHLKSGTTALHESLDQRIMALAPFSSRERFVCFLRMQLRLHLVTSPLYQSAELQKRLPGLGERNRVDAILADCADFAVTEEQLAEDRSAAAAVWVEEGDAALGWLYTHEGSTLGAAFLLKHARDQLGLSETFGARHLAGHTEGRGLHWRRFKDELDAIELTAEQREQALAGARQAFAFVRASVEALMAAERAADAV
ncbi:biliverdin-producing heme oxygenase [Pseudomonas sp. MYb185]|uniref:biliverdin-producing heme oxygenase n=1 Tax=Pseudomonas sp. MYb185 TaxID=1848729 RepID=UPI000CFE16D5|nr:biliverdin-producing heme oxygenase [Pseudomonas sp. MYb185]PRB83906.1 biliverdin-producing heme oxygenase [Pseudomonas sp. MYb185]